MTRVSIHRPTPTPIVAIRDEDLLRAIFRLPRHSRYWQSRRPLSVPVLRPAERLHLALRRGIWCPVGVISAWPALGALPLIP